jgi:nucleoside-diphosphate kinase
MVENNMKTERTFVMIKPDGVQRGCIGDIITRFEQKGIKIVGMKLVKVSKDFAEKHYKIHKGKHFFQSTVEYIISSPVVAMVLEGNNAIEHVRNLMGKTNPSEAAPGTIRGDFGQNISRNIIHGSDGLDTADYEINLWFKKDEIIDYKRIDEIWLKE